MLQGDVSSLCHNEEPVSILGAHSSDKKADLSQPYSW